MSSELIPETYQPDETILQKYADVLVNFALNDGEGINRGDVVGAQLTGQAEPFCIPLQTAILEAGGHPMVEYKPSGIGRAFLEAASDEQIDFYSEGLVAAKCATADHGITIIGSNPHELDGIDSAKVVRQRRTSSRSWAYLMPKEKEGRYSWTGALYGVPEMASEAGMTTKEYWQQIIQACFLDKDDPKAEWQRVNKEIEEKKLALNALKIKSIHLQSDDGNDLRFSMGANRRWVGGAGVNIPSFEIFTSPDFRTVEGHYSPNQPFYYNGQQIRGIELTFKDGEVVAASAEYNEELLRRMIAQPLANRLGEFSLTDRRLSNITRYMATTLYDENIGGPEGNTHVALGLSLGIYAYDGDISQLTQEQTEELGFNESCRVHEDLVSTSNRQVTAKLASGKEPVIYENGEFTV